MGGLDALLTVQEHDLEADRLRERRAELAASREREECAAEIAALEATLAETRGHREELARAERALSVEVDAVASKAKEVETTLYSGRVTVPKELETFEADLRLLRARQAELEERELEQLEAIESAESTLTSTGARRDEAIARARQIETKIAAAEAQIDADLRRREAPREAAAETLPPAVLDAYGRLRKNRRLTGRVVARLGDGLCQGCRTQLPTREYARMRAEPDDAVVACPNCMRLLVR